MPKGAQPIPADALDVLDAYLMSENAPENSMGLSDLDGFFTGLAVGPEQIMPSEWLPLIWGGDEPAFATLDEANIVFGSIMARYNEIIAGRDPASDSFDPVFMEAMEGHIIVTDRAADFMDAVTLRANSWAPILKSERARVLMLPLLVLGSDDERPLFDAVPLPEDQAQRLLENSADILMAIIPAIYEFWQHRIT